MSTAEHHDFRDEEPTWVRYAEWIGNGHDKFYEVRIDMTDDGKFLLTKRWGPRPDRGAGQIKTQPFAYLTHAINSADSMLDSKVRKGYTIVERPMGADRKVQHASPWDDED